MTKINGFDMLRVLLDYADENQLYDTFDELELELNEITKKTKEWELKVKKIYDEMKEKGII